MASAKTIPVRPVAQRNAGTVATRTQVWVVGDSPPLAALWSRVLQLLGAAPSQQSSNVARQIAPISRKIKQNRRALGAPDMSTIVAHAQLGFTINHVPRNRISDRRPLTDMSSRIGVIICVDRPGKPDRAEPLNWRSLQWLQALLSIEWATRNLPRVFVTADALLDDWRFVVGRLAKILELRWPHFSDFAAVEIDRLIAHERDKQAAPTGIPSIPIVEQAHKVFQSMVLSTDGKSQHAAIDRIREQYNVIAANVGPIHGSFLTTTVNGETSVDKFNRLADQPAFSDDSIESLRHELSRRDVEIARLIQRLADARAKAFEYATQFRHARAAPRKSKAE